MIQDVDETLRALVRREALNGAQVEIAFDAPTHEWVARRNAPTVDLYLYDIREDLQRREVQWEDVRGRDGIVTERRPPARRYRLSYMVTAWTQRPEDEHRILSSLLGCFLRHERMGSEECSGELANQPLPLYSTICLPLSADRSIADVWSALGGELKPSLDLVISTPFADVRSVAAGAPVREEPTLRIRGSGRRQIEAAARAARGLGLAALATGNGNDHGTATLQIEGDGGAAGDGDEAAGGNGHASGDGATGPGGPGRGPSRPGTGDRPAGGAGLPPRPTPTQDEERRSGTPSQPGRVVRLRGFGR